MKKVLRLSSFMKGFDRSRSLPPFALTIGQFDGWHNGHLRLIKTLKDTANEEGLQPAILTFFNTPSLEGGLVDPKSHKLLTMRQKIYLLSELCGGFSPLWLLARFDSALIQLSAEDLLRTLYHLGLRYLVVGREARLGHQKGGNEHTLPDICKRLGILLRLVPTAMQTDFPHQKYASRDMRVFVARGDFEGLHKCLSRDFMLIDRVHHGVKIGRTIGIPTLNIPLHPLTPLQGVYVTRVVLGENTYDAVCNAGRRPTMQGRGVWLEAHLLTAPREEFYGACVKVIPLKKIRDERLFPSLDALRLQINEDIAFAKDFFERERL